jgi:PAS domain S-box-containing protein
MSFNSPQPEYSHWRGDWQSEAFQSITQPTVGAASGTDTPPRLLNQSLNQPLNQSSANSAEVTGVAQYSSPSATPVTELTTEPSTTPIYFTLTTTGEILAVNPDGAAQLGYCADALLGQFLTNFVHPSDRDRWQQTRTQLLTSTDHPELLRLMGSRGDVLSFFVQVQALQTLTETTLLTVCTQVEHSKHHDPQSKFESEPAPHPQAIQLLRQQTEWDELLQAMSQPVRQLLELRQILRTVVTEVRQRLEADRVLIYQVHPQKIGNVLAESLAIGCPSLFKQARVATLLQQKCLQFQFTDPLTLLNGIYQAEQSTDIASPALLQSLGVQSELVVPIFQQDSLWGLLIVHQCDRSRPWQPWELGLLKQVGIYLDSVIHQVDLYQKIQRSNADLERQIHARTAELRLASEFEATLKRITDKVRDSLDERQILETAVQELVYAIGISGCNASIYDLDNGTSTICYEHTNNLSPYQGRVVHLDASPEIYNQLLDGQTFQFCSLMINPTRGKVAMLTCPIVDDQGVLGDLWLINQPYYCFTEQDIRLVRQVANQCAIAIRQARLFQAAQAQVEELGRLNRLKDDFLSTVSHELRTPMANIKMATQMLEVTLKQGGLLSGDSPKVGKYFQILQAECQREINLINDLLDLSRLDTEQTAPELVMLDLNTWLPAIVRPFLERADSQQQQLLINIPEPIPPLSADLASLERILTELLQNACKYTPAGETITVSAEFVQPPVSQSQKPALLVKERLNFPPSSSSNLSLDIVPAAPFFLPSTRSSPPAASYLHLSVSNSGVEIPPHEASRIFEKFYRIPSSDRWQHGGTGLGLALVRKLAECLGGAVAVESGTGQTQFIVELPISPYVREC